jgi:hypothetical protein
VFVYVEGGTAFVQVDNMSLKKFNRTGLPIILNGNFEVGDNRFWPRGWSDGVAMSVGDTGVAIATTENYKSIQQLSFQVFYLRENVIFLALNTRLMEEMASVSLKHGREIMHVQRYTLTPGLTTIQ